MNKVQLLKGLFITTGIILGVFFHQVDQATEGLSFALASAAIFYGAFYIAVSYQLNKVYAYLTATSLWLMVYSLFRFL